MRDFLGYRGVVRGRAVAQRFALRGRLARLDRSDPDSIEPPVSGGKAADYLSWDLSLRS